jgi:hypothetical protein
MAIADGKSASGINRVSGDGGRSSEDERVGALCQGREVGQRWGRKDVAPGNSFDHFGFH